MRRTLAALFLLVVAGLGAEDLAFPDLTQPAVLAEYMKAHPYPEVVVIDVRTNDLFVQGHVPGAVNIPLDRIYSDYPSNSARTPLVVYGRPASSDARKAVDILKTRGYKYVFLFGSVNRWEGDLQ